MDIKVYEVNAFTDKLPGGNPAGVVLDSGKLSEEQMQNISREINLSETAFVERIKEDYFKVRFFTPVCEVELCGHATIATFYLLG
ncbi:MAG TPA: PhzF family phenazine biosynthesis isomerase, partial [Tissierellaceae bacterium]|nr:PhzF family phenazine biosynthesis isomerase [Tissierellaceae bacterium]